MMHDPEDPVLRSESTVSIWGRSSTAADAGGWAGEDERYATAERMVVNASMAIWNGG